MEIKINQKRSALYIKCQVRILWSKSADRYLHFLNFFALDQNLL